MLLRLESSHCAMGMDVSEKHGLDIVVLDGLVVRGTLHAETPDEFAQALREFAPDVVGIDSPPAWGKSGKSRHAERGLAKLGISSHAVPSDPAVFDKPFYGWMKVGFAAFDLADRVGYGRYREGEVLRTAIEVFPYGSAVALAGCIPPGKPSDREKMRWRGEVLTKAGVDIQRLTTIDLVDAALAALTGVLALNGQLVGVGDPAEGVIVLPVSALPTATTGKNWEAQQMPWHMDSTTPHRTNPATMGTAEIEAHVAEMHDIMAHVSIRYYVVKLPKTRPEATALHVKLHATATRQPSTWSKCRLVA